MRNNPPTFKGRYDPDGAQNWLQGIERIFRAMVSTNEQKVRLATHMLAEEAEFWWENTRQRLEGAGTVVTWEIFREEFLGKYFPADVCNKKEIEFLELKQGNMTVSEYAAKFESPPPNATNDQVSDHSPLNKNPVHTVLPDVIYPAFEKPKSSKPKSSKKPIIKPKPMRRSQRMRIGSSSKIPTVSHVDLVSGGEKEEKSIEETEEGLEEKEEEVPS